MSNKDFMKLLFPEVLVKKIEITEITLCPSDPPRITKRALAFKNGGKMFISDIVLLKELSKEQRNDEELLSCCVGGALLKQD